jgi:hypothetical protein
MVAKFNKKISKRRQSWHCGWKKRFKTFFPKLETKVLCGFQSTTIVQPLLSWDN